MRNSRCFPHGGVLPALAGCLVILGIALAVGIWLRKSGAHSGVPHPPGGVQASAAAQAPLSGSAHPSAEPSGKAREGEPAKGAARPLAEKLANLDTRSAAADVPAADRRRALEAIRTKVPGVDVRFDPVTGSPSHINAPGRFLTGAAAPGGDVYAPVRQFISDNAALFGHGGDVLDGSLLTREDVTAHNGMRTVVWQQQVDGIPVYNTILKANLTKTGALVTVGSLFMRDAVAATQMDAPARAALEAQPPVDVKKAVSLAAASLDDEVAPEQAVAQSPPLGAERKQRFTVPKLSDTVAQLSWLPTGAESARLTWDVTLMSLKRGEMFRILVDARTGEVLMRTSLTVDISEASYRVYADDGASLQPFDSPTPFSPGWSTPQGTQPAQVGRNLITTQALDVTASPDGWISDGGTETFGNNVDAHLDLLDTNPGYGTGTHAVSATRTFDFTMDLAQAPSAYRDAAMTQLFYLCNWYHDRMYALGFTEASGNFQQSNFGRGGLGGDAVLADAQDGGGTNNANFSTPADGSPGRMQMYLFSGPSPERDGSLDAEIVLHEYTHGLSNRLVGGGVGISALQSAGMGEGWSDFYGIALLSGEGDDVNGNYAAGAYATYQLGGLTENYYYGIRRYPYSTDMTKNPLTLKDIDPAQASSHAGIPRSPIIGSTANEVHNMGEVWCVTLWEARANLIAKLGAAAGNQMILQLVTDGMKLSPPNPTFLEARDAIIQADLVNNAGANRNELWAAFAKRGMGAGATSPSSSTTTGIVEAFDIPDDLGVTPVGAFLATGDAGGPFTPAGNTYTLSNNGAESLNWTASDDAAWLDLGAASGSLAPGTTSPVTATLNAAAAGLEDGFYSAAITFTNTVSGAVLARTVHLRVGQVDYFTEIFNTSAHDIDYQSFMFTPNTTASGYSVLREPVTALFTDPTGGTPLSMSDDTYAQVIPAGGQKVRLYGVNYGSFYVGSNGYITFTIGDTEYLESAATHFDLPRVSVLMDDLLPVTGQVTWRQTADRVAVTWQGVAQYGASDSNTFQIELFFDGRIRITNLAIAAADGLIGLSRGTGVQGDFIESDFSAYPWLSLGLSIPAIATEGDAPVEGTVTASVAPASDLVVSLASSDDTELTVPATATILAGQTSAVFPITIMDDAELDGTQDATISATTAGYAGGFAGIAVQDSETATLAVAAPASASEDVGSVQGTVTVSAAPASAVSVALTSSNTAEVQVPATVMIPAGQTSADFTITVVDDTKIDGTQAATITAHVAGWVDGIKGVNVQDNENSDLALTLPSSVVEGGAATGTVSISGTLASALIVALSSDNLSRLTVPATVSIPAGATFATFALTAPDNNLVDGTQSVTITASASGFTSGESAASVLDEDAHHYAFSVVASPQYRGAPFSVSITAQDAANATLTGYAGTPALTAGGSGGAVPLSPASATGFVNGVWTGNVAVDAVDINVVLTATDGAGHTGASNPFDVAPPPDYFVEWFDAGGPNDTGNQSWLFTPDGSPAFYSVVRTAVETSFPTDPAGGTTLILTDDSTVLVTPTGGAQVKLYGSSYPNFYVGSNGYVTFGSGDSNLTESLVNHFSKPRVAALFDDLNPAAGGTIKWRQLTDRIAVTFQGVPEYAASNSNSFQIELFFDGRIRITCLGIAATDGLIGLSRGLGVPGGFVESDFSTYPSPPTVVTITATGITTDAATLNGAVNPNGQATTAKFEYGPTTAYGSPVSVALSPANGNGTQSVAANLTGLAPGATYHFRATATNPDGTADGGDLTFTTLSLLQGWRQQYFGTTENSGGAADTADPDGDGGSNLFEYVAGLLPNDRLSRFNVRVEEVAGEPGQKAIIFSPLMPGRTYVPKCKASLTDPAWTALTSFTTSDNLAERTVIDLAAGSGAKFYTVEIVLP